VAVEARLGDDDPDLALGICFGSHVGSGGILQRAAWPQAAALKP
jgi:hypothetical protein